MDGVPPGFGGGAGWRWYLELLQGAGGVGDRVEVDKRKAPWRAGELVEHQADLLPRGAEGVCG